MEASRRVKDFLHRRPVPKEPQLPEDDYKVVIRPGGGLDLTRQSLALIRDCVLRAAKVQPDIAGEDTLRINMRQNTMIMSTPSLANAKEYSNIKEIMINDKSYATAAYVTAPENTSKGVIYGIPKYDNQEDIEKSLVNQRNPTILHARRMGLTDSVVIVFEGLFVPYFVYYRGAEYRCFLYKKQYETCTTCGRIGHRADVCPQPDSKKCRGCGVLNPTENHQCVPRCSLCGKGHLTGDKKCKERFRTPYLLKKRWWEKEQQQGDERREMKILSNTRATQAWREGYSPENPTEENGNATKDRGGRRRDHSNSFSRLAEGGREGDSTRTQIHIQIKVHSSTQIQVTGQIQDKGNDITSRTVPRGSWRRSGQSTNAPAQESGVHAAKRRAEEISPVENEDLSKPLEKKVENMLGELTKAPMRGEFPDGSGWDAALLSSDSQIQARLIRQAEDAARAHGIMAVV
ncbi:hypothetical protein HPB51_029191 [Rhipicephalus microplus]|uniref:CCHC-type domain-containing protein n=1 Tax=Rhipicephalus microplus TaxID=6941 RepID=A0A9J6CUT2_RHIMP|nr:hypothetical protein HPB51_029191 [Rhipicephalus microplus]